MLGHQLFTKDAKCLEICSWKQVSEFYMNKTASMKSDKKAIPKKNTKSHETVAQAGNDRKRAMFSDPPQRGRGHSFKKTQEETRYANSTLAFLV